MYSCTVKHRFELLTLTGFCCCKPDCNPLFDVEENKLPTDYSVMECGHAIVIRYLGTPRGVILSLFIRRLTFTAVLVLWFERSEVWDIACDAFYSVRI